MRLFLAFILTAFTPLAAMAQFPESVHTGARVRVWLPEPYSQHDGPWRRQLLRGTVESVASDSLRVAVPGTGGMLAIPRASIRRLDVSHGSSRVASAFERALAGAVAGALSFAILNHPDNVRGPNYSTTWRAAGVGAGWGAGIGAAIGLLFPHEQWRRVRLTR